MSMVRHKQTRAELEAHLAEQLSFLEVSANSFDAGYIGEAKRMATVARILLHQTPHSEALLTQLGMRDRKYFDASFPYDSRNVLTHAGLLWFEVNSAGGAAYTAKIDGSHQRWTEFIDWWERDLVLDDLKGAAFTRRALVLALSNKDGGAHIDPHLDEGYANLKLHNSMAWMKRENLGPPSPVPDAELHSMRAIGHEILKTLKPGYSRVRRT